MANLGIGTTMSSPVGPTVLSLAIGLFILSAGFWLMDRLRPAERRTRRRPSDTRVDEVPLAVLVNVTLTPGSAPWLLSTMLP